jgi:rhodanese-related sulfurtransferase
MFKPLLALSSFLTLGLWAATDPQEAYEKVRQGQAVMFDVREKHELSEGMIKLAQWFPLSRTSEEGWVRELRELTQGKEIYLYCRSGARSGRLRQQLKSFSLDDGNLGGFADLRKSLPVTLKIP